VFANLPAHYQAVFPLAGPPAAALFGQHAVTVVLVTFRVLALVALAAFLLYIFTLPSDPGGTR